MRSLEKKSVVNLGPVNKIPLGQGVVVVVQNVEIAVFRLREGRVIAVANKCPHRGGPLSDGITGQGKVVCPLHGHKFDLETGQGSEPNECVRVFKTWEEDGQVMMEYPSL